MRTFSTNDFVFQSLYTSVVDSSFKMMSMASMVITHEESSMFMEGLFIYLHSPVDHV